MMQTKSSSHLFLYFVYGILLTLVLLYFRFPTAEFKTYCEQRIEHALNDTTCTIDQIRYKLPAILKVLQNLMAGRMLI